MNLPNKLTLLRIIMILPFLLAYVLLLMVGGIMKVCRIAQTRLLFSGNLIKHPCFDEMRASGTGYRVVGGLDNTDFIMNNTFWVGVYPGMTDEMIDYMAKVILEAIA